jgi:hypothetical protein
MASCLRIDERKRGQDNARNKKNSGDKDSHPERVVEKLSGSTASGRRATIKTNHDDHQQPLGQQDSFATRYPCPSSIGPRESSTDILEMAGDS